MLRDTTLSSQDTEVWVDLERPGFPSLFEWAKQRWRWSVGGASRLPPPSRPQDNRTTGVYKKRPMSGPGLLAAVGKPERRCHSSPMKAGECPLSSKQGNSAKACEEGVRIKWDIKNLRHSSIMTSAMPPLVITQPFPPPLHRLLPHW